MFKDKNLKLAILNYTKSLQEKYLYGWDKDYDKFCMKNFGKIISDNEYGGNPSKEIESFFLNLEISKEELESITDITFDADNSVYIYIIRDVVAWVDYFDIHSLEGIENCNNLKNIDLNYMTNKVSVEPLTKLHTLEHIRLDGGHITDYNPLLDIPNLKKVSVWNFYSCFKQKDKENFYKVALRLEKKGVLVVDTSNKKLIINM